ncbi:hypothetical protein [Sphingomonas sp.]|uniref:hypothetical protein n=1 Tax=Sphingomonas sp. TaxID=28214 RepID=UPI00333F3657
MNFRQYFSPIRAYHDLRSYVVTRRPHQIGFMALSLVLSYTMIVGTLDVTRMPKPAYHREVIYVQQWRADRTDAEIIAQQKIDGVEQTRQEQELKRLQAERKVQLKKLDNALKSFGI